MPGGLNTTTLSLIAPGDTPPTLTDQLVGVSGGIAAYESLNATVYAISVDSPFAQDAWAKANKITVPLLSDLNKTVTKAYDVLFPMLAGVGVPEMRSIALARSAR